DISREDLLQYLDYEEGDYGYDKAVKKWLGNDLPGFIKSMISDFKYKDLSLEQAGNLLQDCSRKDQYLYWSLLTYIEYQKYLNRAGMLDYTDLIVKASKLLDKDAELLGRLQSKYKYIFEDEAQDSNLVQNRILLKLAANNRNLIKVGDPNQSIMSTFTLADPGVFRKYNNKDQVQVNYMLESSRSTEEIIELANYFVKWIVEEFPAESCRQAVEEKYIKPVYEVGQLVNPETEGYTIASYTFKDSEEELDKIVGQAIRQIENNSDKTLAILVPYNYMLVKIADKLKSRGIEYQNTGSYIGEEILVIEKFHRLLNFIARPQSENYLVELVYNFFLPEYLAGEADWISGQAGRNQAQADKAKRHAGDNNSKESQVQGDKIKEFFKEHQPEDILYPLGGEGVLARELKGLN
ncbi:MAG: UvrD-helicase domain-containing protein, partial [Halarsenatibacteraceae bacterium]